MVNENRESGCTTIPGTQKTGSAFLIRIRIHDGQVYADPCGSGSTTLVNTYVQKTDLSPTKERFCNVACYKTMKHTGTM